MDLAVMEEESQVGFDELKLNEVVAKGSLDFDAWTSLISKIEKMCPDDIEKICLVYDSFLSEFPLCYGYWKKYADHKTRLCTVDKAIEVFEQAVNSATYSVGVWVDYCSFSMLVFEDPNDIRRLFKRGLSFIGKDYLCHNLWDKFIEFEFSQQQWISLAHIYIQTLRFPTKKLHHYYDSFKKLTSFWEEEMECRTNSSVEEQSVSVRASEATTCYKDDEILRVIKDLLDPSMVSFRPEVLQKYLSVGEKLYQEACDLDAKIHCFETHIRRPYFHVEPIDASQLENWHHYLDFVEIQEDFDWAVKLYERCLIPCANYPEFWMRYVEFMETKGGREIANFALDRATQIFVKNVRAIHLFNARFKEQTGDTFGAHAAFLECDADSDSNFIENVKKVANMEKRLGNFVAASNIYIEALEMAAKKQKLHTLPILYIHFSRLKYMTTGSVDAAREVLIDGIKHVPHCKLLLEELINFAMMHGGPRHIHVVDSIVANAISPGPDVSQGFSSKDREDISSLYLEFVDLCGTIHDVRKAWNRHIRLFSHSVRISSSYKHPATCTKPLKVAIERKDTLVDMSHHPSRDHSSDHMIELPIGDQELSLLENHHFQSDQATTDQLQSEGANNSARERLQQASSIVPEQSAEDVPELNASTVDLLHQVANDIESMQASLEYSEAKDIQQETDCEIKQDLKLLTLESLSLNPQDNKIPDSIPTTSNKCEAHQAICMSNASTLESHHNTNENPCRSSSLGTLPVDSSQVLNESMVKSGQNPNGIPPTSSPIGTPTGDSTQSLNGIMLESGHSTNGNPPISSPIGTLATDSAQIQIEPMSPSSSGSDENPRPTQAQVPANSGGNWHQMNNFNKPHRDLSSEEQHQQLPISPQQQSPHTEIGAQMLMNQGCAPQPLSGQDPQVQHHSPARTQYQAAATQAGLIGTHVWQMQNVQQQGFVSPSQSQLPMQPVSYPQAQTPQYPMQSIDQSEQMQSSQAYNQMWQYYYYQQQQFLLQQQHYQQQQLQLQQHMQPQPQQQLLQQYQQQQLQLQQNYLQQQQQPNQQQLSQLQQEQQLQLQQQYLQQQQTPYQLQQFQQQQHLLYLQQQQQHEQYLQSLQQQQQQQSQLHQSPSQLQQHQQVQQQQQSQLHQSPSQQQQHRQVQQQQQQQQLQQLLQQQEQEQKQHQQQTSSSQIQTQNSNLYQQGEGPHGTPSSGPAVSPHSQHQSPQNQ